MCYIWDGKSDEDKYRQRCYALLEYQQAGKTEYAVRCFTEEDEADTALCWMNPRLAQDFEKAYAVLYHLALRQVPLFIWKMYWGIWSYSLEKTGKKCYDENTS